MLHRVKAQWWIGLLGLLGTLFSHAQAQILHDKTLVVWCTPANLEQQGGAPLALDTAQGKFDALVIGEIEQGKWMAGSEMFSRTERNQKDWPAETVAGDGLVMIALAYQGREVTIYRNEQRYAHYTIGTEPAAFGPQSIVMMGPRMLEQFGRVHFQGRIAEARIYDRALDPEAIARLRPGESGTPPPWAWWSFANGSIQERTGRFPASVLSGGAKVEQGRLILADQDDALLATQGENAAARLHAFTHPVPEEQIAAARELRERLLKDPHRPTFHFVIPEDYGMPFDPNGAIFWNGRAHLFYIYQDRGVHKFGHVSSADLLHWRHHPTALGPTPDSPEKGIFSGNCFINKQGAATMLYHGVDAGNCIATSKDPRLETWRKLPGNPIIPNPPQGAPYASWDPHGWLEGDTYYAIFGGSRAAIFKAKELNQWQYVGDFLHHTVEGVDLREDISCPDFFPMGKKHVLVCISHRLGTRYYVGDWKNEQFYPEYHEQMSWVDNAYFAPETMLLPDGRRLLWAWMFDGRSRLTQRSSGWSGEMALVRELQLGPDNRLRQKPLRELEKLRQNERSFEARPLAADSTWVLDGIQGDALEVELEIDPGAASEVGLIVARAPNAEEETRVSYHAADHQLRVDARKSSLQEGPRNLESAPFILPAGETLRLRVFLDRSVVEAFAQDRQAAMRRIYPSRKDSQGLAVFAQGGAARLIRLKVWDMAPTNPH